MKTSPTPLPAITDIQHPVNWRLTTAWNCRGWVITSDRDWLWTEYVVGHILTIFAPVPYR